MEAYNSLEAIAERPESDYSEKHALGKKMFQARSRTKELEEKLKSAENRIKHLNMEQNRSQQSSKIQETKASEISVIKENHQKLKQELIDWRLTSDQAVNNRRREINQLRKKRNESLKSAKSQVVSKNQSACVYVKTQSKANELFIQKYRDATSGLLKEQAQKINKYSQVIKHKRNATSRQEVLEKEHLYTLRLENEIKNHEELVRKIEQLVKTEENLSSKMVSQDRSLYSNCALFCDKFQEKEKEENVTSIV